jgi:glycosyltransferase involved in cell wall biosynthesis
MRVARNVEKADITVLICVHLDSKAELLRLCLKSVSAQSYRFFKVLLVLDGEVTGELHAVIGLYKTKIPIRIIQLDTNSGLAVALNAGLKSVDTKYVARIDCDDIMQQDRLKKQKEYLDTYSFISAIGSAVDIVSIKSNKTVRVREVPQKPENTLKSKFISPMNHPSVTFRLDDVLAVGGYPLFRKVQDRALWGTLMMKGYTLRNSDEKLTTMHYRGKSARSFNYLRYELKVVNYLYKIKYLNSFQMILNYVALVVKRSVQQLLRN